MQNKNYIYDLVDFTHVAHNYVMLVGLEEMTGNNGYFLGLPE